MNNEVWKDIPGFEGIYQVSNLGRIKTLSRKIDNGANVKRLTKEFVMTPHKTYKGYLEICLSKEGVSKQYKVHRLVALAFLPNPHNYPMVNHKDEVKDNNNVNNLEWCTASYNTLYGTGRARRAKHFFKPIIMLDANTEKVIATFESIKMAEEKTGVLASSISDVCNKVKHHHTAGGYKWRYADETN